MIISNFTVVLSKNGKTSLINTINDSKTLEVAKAGIEKSFEQLDELFDDGYEVVNGLYSIFINEPQDSYKLGTQTPVDNLSKLYPVDMRKDNRWVYSNIYEYDIYTKKSTRVEVICDGSMIRRDVKDYDDDLTTYHNGDIVDANGTKYIITDVPSFNKYKWENSYLLNPAVQPGVVQDATAIYQKDPLLTSRVHASNLTYLESPDIKYTCNIYYIEDDKPITYVLRTNEVQEMENVIKDFNIYDEQQFLIRISISEIDTLIEISNQEFGVDNLVSIDIFSNSDNIMKVIFGDNKAPNDISINDLILIIDNINKSSDEEVQIEE